MKNILFAVIITFFVTGTAYAGTIVLRTGHWGIVQAKDQTTYMYKIEDNDNGTVCYLGYMKGNANVQPTMSCVKVK